jgi:hypothetical protein
MIDKLKLLPNHLLQRSMGNVLKLRSIHPHQFLNVAEQNNPLSVLLLEQL